MTVEPTAKDKQITIEVPEDRVAEFYAFYGRFLAGGPGHRRRGHRQHRHGCGPQHARHRDTEAAEQPGPDRPEPVSI
ncbi:MAG: hypothetical protein QOG15_1713 [Solirubrobacteraceae bacterium]|jgi:hypothetical protein|nr:hypothetical protein [Solirubrobacteraceae bacterium]